MEKSNGDLDSEINQKHDGGGEGIITKEKEGKSSITKERNEIEETWR
jgi:hypothetical protein